MQDPAETISFYASSILYKFISQSSRTFDATIWTQILNLYNQISAKKTRRKIVSAHVLWIALNHSSGSLCDLLTSLNADAERKYFYLEDIGDNFRKFDRSILIQVWERAAHPFLLDQFHRNTEYSLFTVVSWLPFEFSLQNLSSFLSTIVQFFPKFAETPAQVEDLCSFMLKVLESEINFCKIKQFEYQFITLLCLMIPNYPKHDEMVKDLIKSVCCCFGEKFTAFLLEKITEIEVYNFLKFMIHLFDDDLESQMSYTFNFWYLLQDEYYNSPKLSSSESAIEPRLKEIYYSLFNILLQKQITEDDFQELYTYCYFVLRQDLLRFIDHQIQQNSNPEYFVAVLNFICEEIDEDYLPLFYTVCQAYSLAGLSTGDKAFFTFSKATISRFGDEIEEKFVHYIFSLCLSLGEEECLTAILAQFSAKFSYADFEKILSTISQPGHPLLKAIGKAICHLEGELFYRLLQRIFESFEFEDFSHFFSGIILVDKLEFISNFLIHNHLTIDSKCNNQDLLKFTLSFIKLFHHNQTLFSLQCALILKQLIENHSELCHQLFDSIRLLEGCCNSTFFPTDQLEGFFYQNFDLKTIEPEIIIAFDSYLEHSNCDKTKFIEFLNNLLRQSLDADYLKVICSILKKAFKNKEYFLKYSSEILTSLYQICLNQSSAFEVASLLLFELNLEFPLEFPLISKQIHPAFTKASFIQVITGQRHLRVFKQALSSAIKATEN